MRICLIVDAQSPHSQRWIELLDASGNEVHLVSTWPVENSSLPVHSVFIAPIDFSAKVRSGEKAASMGTASGGRARIISRLRGTRLWRSLSGLRNKLAPRLVEKQSVAVAQHLKELKPDIVHAMRIPFEGLLAASAIRKAPFPFVVSTWGNDFSLFAARDKEVRGLTLKLLSHVDAVHSDCKSDLDTAIEWGLSETAGKLVAPGNGGIDRTFFHKSANRIAFRQKHGIKDDSPLIINPRGLKEYIRNDTIFAAIPLVLERFPNAIFLCVSMEGKAIAEQYCEQYGIKESVRLLPSVTHSEMAELFQASEIVISSSDHDGTPISLLEAMACGCFPIAGDIASSHEWIRSGENGFIHDQSSPRDLADKIILALEQPALQEQAAEMNEKIVSERADRATSVRRMMELYEEAIRHFESARLESR